MKDTPKTKPDLISLNEIERRYSPGIGRHWFDADTKRFFRTRLPQYGYEGPGGVYFVSSEQNRCGGMFYPRLYTVRQLVGPGKIKTTGDFNVLSRSAANTMAKRLAMGKPVAALAID